MIVAVEAPTRLPPTIAMQVFTIGSAIAGGLAGIKLSQELAKVPDVPTRAVAVATIVSILFTLGGGLYLAKKATEGAYGRRY